jgi:hypothetical protein
MIQRQIELGYFGLVGFPLIALVYAITRKAMAPEATTEAILITRKANEAKKHVLYPKFVSEDPERQYLYKEVLPEAFQSWLEKRKHSTRST